MINDSYIPAVTASQSQPSDNRWYITMKCLFRQSRCVIDWLSGIIMPCVWLEECSWAKVHCDASGKMTLKMWTNSRKEEGQWIFYERHSPFQEAITRWSAFSLKKINRQVNGMYNINQPIATACITHKKQSLNHHCVRCQFHYHWLSMLCLRYKWAYARRLIGRTMWIWKKASTHLDTDEICR